MRLPRLGLQAEHSERGVGAAYVRFGQNLLFLSSSSIVFGQDDQAYATLYPPSGLTYLRSRRFEPILSSLRLDLQGSSLVHFSGGNETTVNASKTWIEKLVVGEIA